jgi:hypothetical protein
MDFGLSEEQVLLQETVRRFLAARCPTPRVREIMETPPAHDAELWNGLAELGVPSILVPEVHGGLGQELLDLAIVAEELGYAATPGPFLASAMATVALAHADDEGVKSVAAALASGESVGAIAIGEANGVGLDRLTRAPRVGSPGKAARRGRRGRGFRPRAALATRRGLYLVDAVRRDSINALKTSDMTVRSGRWSLPTRRPNASAG